MYINKNQPHCAIASDFEHEGAISLRSCFVNVGQIHVNWPQLYRGVMKVVLVEEFVDAE